MSSAAASSDNLVTYEFDYLATLSMNRKMMKNAQNIKAQNTKNLEQIVASGFFDFSSTAILPSTAEGEILSYFGAPPGQTTQTVLKSMGNPVLRAMLAWPIDVLIKNALHNITKIDPYPYVKDINFHIKNKYLGRGYGKELLVTVSFKSISHPSLSNETLVIKLNELIGANGFGAGCDDEPVMIYINKSVKKILGKAYRMCLYFGTKDELDGYIMWETPMQGGVKKLRKTKKAKKTRRTTKKSRRN